MSDSLILASYGIDVTDLEIYEVLDQTDREISINSTYFFIFMENIGKTDFGKNIKKLYKKLYKMTC